MLPAYYPLQIAGVPDQALPEGTRIARGWSAIPIGHQEALHLIGPHSGDTLHRPVRTSGRLRIAAALDYRDAQYVEAILAVSGISLGRLDIRFAYVFQPFELVLTAEQTEAVLREGVLLRVSGGQTPLWIFDDLGGDATRRLFAPHLLIGEADTRMDCYVESFVSLSSLQPFGWLEGCVLDGLYALRPVLGAARIDPVIDAHLEQYIDGEGRLLYEDLRGRAADGTFTTIEATLPLAIILKHRPDSPIIKQALAFWDSRGANGDGAVIDGHTITAEGMYTVAYPLAVMAVRLGRKDLAEQAVRQVLLRRDSLAEGKHVYLRYHKNTTSHSFRNWARAYAWYMLGMTRTWIELKQSAYAGLPGVLEMEQELARIAEIALSWRQQEGLWSNFLDEPDTGIDTSGSAGIAAALALGARHGLLPSSYVAEAKVSLQALEAYLTPDGILSGVAQHNAGGLELQRCGYRVLSQMGMGLMAQLYAATRADTQG
ncbi:MAG: hypothetical protein K0Q59_4528 [Paenibacillus sp.]|nr:hypothetical protein [Paenibacillus sp.]